MQTTNHDVIGANTQHTSVQQSMQLLDPSLEPSLDRKWIALLFKRFNNIYLSKWTDQFTNAQLLEAHMQEWSIGLYGLTPYQLKQGVAQCRTNSDWPPEISKFIAYATSEESLVHKSEAYRPWHALPSPKGDLALAIRALEQVKRILL